MIFRHLFCFNISIKQEERAVRDRSSGFQRFFKGGRMMKGYNVEGGYMGLVDGRFVLFASESDYRDYMED